MYNIFIHTQLTIITIITNLTLTERQYKRTNASGWSCLAIFLSRHLTFVILRTNRWREIFVWSTEREKNSRIAVNEDNWIWMETAKPFNRNLASSTFQPSLAYSNLRHRDQRRRRANLRPKFRQLLGRVQSGAEILDAERKEDRMWNSVGRISIDQIFLETSHCWRLTREW